MKCEHCGATDHWTISCENHVHTKTCEVCRGSGLDPTVPLGHAAKVCPLCYERRGPRSVAAEKLVEDTTNVIAGLSRTIDEVMPLAQCLGALSDYLKNDLKTGLAYDKERGFVLVRLINAQVSFGADYFCKDTHERVVLGALNNWFAKDPKS